MEEVAEEDAEEERRRYWAAIGEINRTWERSLAMSEGSTKALELRQQRKSTAKE